MSIICPSPRFWEALGNSGCFWETVGSFGRLWKALVYASEGFGRLWKAWEGFGRLLDVLGCFGRLAASVRLSKALIQWLLWKVSEALGVFERYGRLLEGFRKL